MKEKRLVVDVPETLHKRFKKYCGENGLKIKDTTINIISKYLLEAETHPNYFERLRRKEKEGERRRRTG